MTDAKTSLARDGTMQVTAKEGIGYLKAEGKDALLKVQGLVEDKPAVPRDGTMVSTAKEADRILGNKKPDEDAQTRSQNKQIEDLKKEKTPEPPAKKAKLAKDGTMAVTAKEGKALLAGEKLADTRQETAVQKSKAKTPLRKNTTIAKAIEEAKYVLDGDVDMNSGRKTRSQSRGETPKAALKKAGTMQVTAKEGKEFLNRGKGKKGKAAAQDAEAAATEELATEENKS
ncbi:eukaryotic translation initiation factor 3 subunit f [Plakobranchus ocellatus]|uniref:Eukaryotic translation initiation factor 3 subunit f n=1 Tax=Plakobranchus ocellatus TaxID=259542 RepID=A0AAV4BQV4_9GAST|nr:eukaryotic translation initiation factor 3 subunit f [Plakobranchus ocellatus]